VKVDLQSPSSSPAGALAALVGSGVIRDVADQLLQDFATCLAGRLG
jgi:carbon monoxide dehydrogenase subunit G